MPRKAIEWALRKQKVPEWFVTAVMFLYAKFKGENSSKNIRDL